MSALAALLQPQASKAPAPITGGNSALAKLASSQAAPVQPRGAQAVNPPSTSPFNPNTPGHDEYVKQLDLRAGTTSTAKNFLSSIPGALKTVGKLATDLPVNLVKSTYNQYAHPSAGSQQVEQAGGVNNLPPGIKQVAQGAIRTFVPGVEGLAKDIGQGNIKNFTKLSPQEKINTAINAANAGLTFASVAAPLAVKKAFEGAKSEVPAEPSAIENLSKTAVNSLENKNVGVKPGALENAKAEIQKGVTPSVKVRTLEDGSTFIEDGRHHLEAAKQLGVKDYPVEDVTSKYQPKTAVENGTSKIAKSIEAKAVEQKLTQGFDGIAGYDKITIKDQANKATNLFTDPEKAMRVIKGEEDLPEGLRGTAVITAAEEHIEQTGDARMAYELANSPLVSETSKAAQEMRLAAEREPDSLTAKLQEIRKAKEQAATQRYGNIPKAKTKIISDITGEIKKAAPKARDWQSFIESIKCT